MKGKKTGGRKAGTPNRITAKMRQRFEALLASTDIEADFAALSPSERVRMFVSIAEFVIPRQQRTDAAVEQRLNELESLIKQGTNQEN